MIKKFLSLLFFTIFFVGCSHNNKISVPPEPSWYLNPPKSDSHFVYVTGAGLNEQKAVENALSHFISQYSITISSKFQSQMKNFGGGLVQKKIEYDIKSVIKEFEVSNYEVLKNYPYSFNQKLVLVRVDVDKLYQNIKNRLDNQFRFYQNRYYSIVRENLLSQFIELRKMYQELQKKRNYITVLKAMNKNFDDKSYLAFINAIEKRLYIIKNNLSVTIYSNNPIIAEDISKYLTSKGIRIGRSYLVIEAIVKNSFSNSYNTQLEVYKIYLNLKYGNRILGNNFFQIVAPPQANISGYLYDDIKNLPLEKFLNLR